MQRWPWTKGMSQVLAPCLLCSSVSPSAGLSSAVSSGTLCEQLQMLQPHPLAQLSVWQPGLTPGWCQCSGLRNVSGDAAPF